MRMTSEFAIRNCGLRHSSASKMSGLRISALKPAHCFGEPTTTRTQPSDAGSTQYAPSALRRPVCRQQRVDREVVLHRHRPRDESREPGLLRADLDDLAGAVVAPGAVEDRGDGTDGAVDRCAVVREVTGAVAGWEVGEAGRPQRARRRQRGKRFEVPVGPRPAQPEIGQRHVHEVRVGGDELVADAGVLDQHVHGREQLVESCAVRGILELEHDAALVRVAVGVGERVGRIAPLDADHVGAEVGQDARAERAAQIGEIDDSHPRQRPGRHPANPKGTVPLHPACR